MKLEDIEKYISYYNDDPNISMHKKYAIYQEFFPKLLAVAKAAKIVSEISPRLCDEDVLLERALKELEKE